MGELKIIARVHNDFPSKFGLPRQSGLVDEVTSKIVFEPAYRLKEALRGIEEYSHLWLIWGFHQAEIEQWSPTVRPPKLGGNKRMGVFSTRSPFRPNPIGLSCVRLLHVQDTANGTVLVVAGTDMMDGTPIYDIKPYLPYADAHPEATGGFTAGLKIQKLQVLYDEKQLFLIPEAKRAGLIGILSEDPRPGYQHDPDRVYGLDYAGYTVRFQVCENELTIKEIFPIADK